MVKLLINNLLIDFVGTHNPINFYYNLTDNRFFQNEGEIKLKEIYFSGDQIEKIDSIKLVGNVTFLDLSNFESCYIEQNDKFININLKFKDIFNIFEEATTFFNAEFIASNSTYNCFSTSMNCNLSCPYCIYNCKNGVIHKKSNLILGKFYIDKIINTIDNICKPKYEAIRIMGGETLIDLKDFNNTVKFANSIVKRNIDDIWIYTNLTINVNEFIKIIDKYLEENIFKKITIIFTSDSLNYNLSKRIQDRKIMNTFISNVKKILSYYKNNNRVLTASNLMYVSKEECYNTAKKLYSFGLKFLQISYDEFTDRNYVEDITNNIHKIYCKLEKEGVKRLKENLGTTMWFHFFIDDEKNNIYQCKYSFLADYTISKLNDY